MPQDTPASVRQTSFWTGTPPTSHPWWCDRRTCLRAQDGPDSAFTRHARRGAFLRLSVMKYDDESGVIIADFTSDYFDHWTDALSLAREALTMGLLLLVLRRPGTDLIGGTVR